MSNQTDQQDAFAPRRPRLALDRENRKLLGVCGGFARYLEVPAALVRVIYCIACLVSPVLLIIYFVLYWLLQDEDRAARIKAAVSRTPDSESTDNKEGADMHASMHSEPRAGRRFNIKRPLHRSRHNVRVAGVCAGIAEYLDVSTFLVRAITLMSLFILGGITIWGYVILWIVLDKEPKFSKKGVAAGQRGQAGTNREESRIHVEQCIANLRATEQRLQEVEAFITSKQFRLYCEINRI